MWACEVEESGGGRPGADRSEQWWGSDGGDPKWTRRAPRTVSIAKSVAKKLLRSLHSAFHFAWSSIALFYDEIRVLERTAPLCEGEQNNESNWYTNNVDRHGNARNRGPDEPLHFVASDGHVSDHKRSGCADVGAFECHEHLRADRRVNEEDGNNEDLHH